MSNWKSHYLLLLKPKSANVLGAVNKPLSSAGKQLQSKASRMETASNEDSSSNPGSPQRSKTRYKTFDANKGAGKNTSTKSKKWIPFSPGHLGDLISVLWYKWKTNHWTAQRLKTFTLSALRLTTDRHDSCHFWHIKLYPLIISVSGMTAQKWIIVKTKTSP